MKHHRINCIFFIIIFFASTACADVINIHITDFGINQYWDFSMKVGDDFTISSDPKHSHNQVYSDMHDMVRQLLGANAKSQILIPMPEDSIMNSDQDIEDLIYQKLKATVQKATANGNRGFEFQLVQHIKTVGYIAPWRQDMVTKYGKAAYGAIARVTNELRNDYTCSVDATIGSNGTVAIGRAVEKLKSVSDLFAMLDFVDGRASYKEMNEVIKAFGASKINFSNTQGDWWGHSPKMTGDKASISNHETSKRLLLENPMINYEWVVPLDSDADAHVLRMAQQDAEFRVRKFYVSGNNKLETYNLPIPMSSREIRQVFGASDRYGQLNQRPISLVISDRVWDLDNGYTAARYIASKIPRNSKVVYIDSRSDENPMQYLLTAKVTPENLFTLSRQGSDAELVRQLRKADADFVITFESEAPKFQLPRALYVVGRDTCNAVRNMTELYADLLKEFKRLSPEEKGTLSALKMAGNLEKLVQAYEQDQKNGMYGDPLGFISSDFIYEATKMFSKKAVKKYVKALQDAAKEEGKKLNVHALTSIIDASEVIANAIREGRAPFTGNRLEQYSDIQEFAKAGVGGLSYWLGLEMSGGDTTVASGFEMIGKAAADLTDTVSLRAFTHMAVHEKRYSENLQHLLDFWEQEQGRRLERNQDIQSVEDYFGEDNLYAMGLSSKDIQNLNNSVIQKAFRISGVLKEYSVHRYKDIYGCDTNIQRLVYETTGKDGNITKTVRTSIVRRQYRNGQEENRQIYHAMNNDPFDEKEYGGVFIDPESNQGGKVNNRFINQVVDDRPEQNSTSWRTMIPEGIE